MKKTVEISSKLFLPVYQFLPFVHYRYIILYGSRDSGKTHNIALKCILKILTEPYARGVLVRKVYSDIKDSQFQKIVDIIEDLELKDEFIITTSPLKIVCKKNKNQIIARGMDKSTKLKSISDPTFIWYEEANELTLIDFLRASQSLRSTKPATIQEFISFNPEDMENNWIYHYFFPPIASFEKEDGVFKFVPSTKKNTLICHTTYKDNKYCSPERAFVLENLKDISKEFYRMYVLGLFGGVLKGLVYEHYNLVDEFPEGCDWVVWGLDFGYTNDPSALVRIGKKSGGLYYKEEFYRTGMLNNDIHHAFKEVGIRPGIDEICADSASPKDIEDLRKYGWNIRGAGQKDIKYRIATVKSYPMNIVKSSLNLIKELKRYKYKENKNIPEDDPGHFINEPIDLYNHLMDALGYGVVYKIPMGGRRGVKTRLPQRIVPDPLGLKGML